MNYVVPMVAPRFPMATRRVRPVGRPKKEESQRSNIRRDIYVNEHEDAELNQVIPPTMQKGTKLKEVVMQWARGEMIARRDAEHEKLLAISQIGVNDLELPHLGTVVCGPLKEAVAEPQTFTISEATAGFMQADEDDFWFDAENQSLEGAGIYDGYRLLMRPLGAHNRAKVGQVVLVESVPKEGDPTPTYTLKRLKRTMPFEVEKVEIDVATGAEIVEDFPLPEKANNKAVAVLIGLIASFI